MIEKEDNFLSFILYFGQKDNYLKKFLEMLYIIADSNFKQYEIICVSNFSEDQEIDIIKSFKNKYEKINITIIYLDSQQGLEECMNAGVDLAIGDFIFEFNTCYFDYTPSVIMEVYKELLKGYDVVSATPPKNSCRISSRFFYSIYNRFSHSKELRTERFCAISRRALNRASDYNRTIPYRKAIYASIGLKTINVEYSLIDKVNINQDVMERNDIAINSLIMFTDIAYRLSFGISVLMAVFMLATGIYTIIIYFGVNKPVKGWSPLMGILSAAFLGIFLVLTVVIKYLDIILKLLFKKQKYIVANIEKL